MVHVSVVFCQGFHFGTGVTVVTSGFKNLDLVIEIKILVENKVEIDKINEQDM